MRQNPRSRFLRCQRGATAVEFAIVAPAFLALLLAIIQLALLALSAASLNYSVEKGARCAALDAACPAYDSNYFAPGPKPAYTLTTASCGKQLQASVTFQLNLVIYKAAIPLSASACFP